MSLFTNTSMDAVIIIFFTAGLIKYLVYNNKDSKYLSAIVAGGALIFLGSILPTLALSNLLKLEVAFFDPALSAVFLLGYIIIIYGTLNIINDILKKRAK